MLNSFPLSSATLCQIDPDIAVTASRPLAMTWETNFESFENFV